MTAVAAPVAVVAVACWLRSRLTRVPRPAAAERGRSRRRPPTDLEWAGLLDFVAGEVRAGSSLGHGVAASTLRAGLVGQAIHPASTVTQLQRASTTDPGEAVVLQAITVAAVLGGPAASALEAGAALLRERATVRAELAAHSAQARLSARVLTAVPLVFAGWSVAASASFRAALLSPAGTACAAAGMSCNAAGWWWMRRIVAGAAP